jgi:hypothetical protein
VALFNNEKLKECVVLIQHLKVLLYRQQNVKATPYSLREGLPYYVYTYYTSKQKFTEQPPVWGTLLWVPSFIVTNNLREMTLSITLFNIMTCSSVIKMQQSA